jgi:hypothetical protein
VTDAPATHPRALELRDLDDVARELAAWGWVVRFEPSPVAAGGPGGHLVLTRPLSSKAAYVVARPRRHEFRVWVRAGDDTWPLGTVPDAGELADLLRRDLRASGPAQAPWSAPEPAFSEL